MLDSIKVENWERDQDLESSFSNNMVTRSVDAFRWQNYFILARKTKLGIGVELYVRRGNKSKYLINSEFDLTEDDVEEVTNNLMVSESGQEVINLLSDHGESFDQSQISEELDWSSSKTSRVLSGLEEVGYIDRESSGNTKTVVLE